MSVREDLKLVLARLLSEDLEAGSGHDASVDAVLGEEVGGLDGEGNLGSSGDEGEGGILDIAEDVGSLYGVLDGRALELGKVLAGEAVEARSKSAGCT